MTGSQKDWYWIRRGMAAATLVGGPLLFLQQVKAELWVRQALADEGYAYIVDWLRREVRWLDIPVDVEPQYASALRPSGDDTEGPSAAPSSAHSGHLPPLMDVHVPCYASGTLETPVTLSARAAREAQAAAGLRQAAERLDTPLASAAVLLQAEQHVGEAHRLGQLLDRFKSGLWRPGAQIASQTGASGPHEAHRNGSPTTSVMDACPHMDDDAEHTAAALHGRRRGGPTGRPEDRRQLVLSATAEEAASIRLQAVKARIGAAAAPAPTAAAAAT